MTTALNWSMVRIYCTRYSTRIELVCCARSILIQVVTAAGNDGVDACTTSPGRALETINVAATGISDQVKPSAIDTMRGHLGVLWIA